ncbi:MAG: hypothetical protein AABZ06_04950 [Bdellovibrionota bacterium]
MKLFGIICLLIMLPVWPLVIAYADHGDADPSSRLRAEARELNEIVQQSWLRYQVKASVQRFATQAEKAGLCAGGSGGLPGEPGDNILGNESSEIIKPLDHSDGNCIYEIQMLRNVWVDVERYLYDTTYDFPHVYRQYVQTRQALRDFLAVNRGRL